MQKIDMEMQNVELIRSPPRFFKDDHVERQRV
jgi:hypothetical protein